MTASQMRSKNPYDSGIRPIINSVVGAVSSANLLPHSLEMDNLVLASIVSAGSEDFGGDDWSEPLELLLEGYATSAKLTDLGKVVARRLILGMLINRLRTVQRLKALGDLPKVQKLS